MFPINPAPDRVIIQPLSQNVRTNGGIELNMENIRRTRWGILKATGNSLTLNAASGEDEVYVLYAAGSEMSFEISGEIYAIVRVCDILALVGNTNQD